MSTSLEQKWVEKWHSLHVFEPSSLSKEKKFFFTVPYAYPTGPLHVGHGRTYTNGDVTARFHRLKGENVFWPMGFHVTGTPVLAISDALKRNDEEMKKLYTEYVGIYEKDPKKIQSLIQSFVDPANVANYFASHVQEDLQKLGCSIDWRPMFTTMDKEYQKFIHWQFRKLYAKGALVKGKYPILYSPADKNAVGEDDIKDGDTDKVQIQEYTLVKFPFDKPNAFLVASTLRPETLFGCTNLWINPQIEYARTRWNNEEWIIAEKAIEKLQLQGKKFEIMEKFSGQSLIDKHASNPLDEKTKIPILPASFVSAEKGTGVVYSVPAHAPWDFIALYELKQQKYPSAEKISPITIIDTPGFEGIEKLLAAHKAISLKHREGIQAATEEIYKKEFYEGKMNLKNGFLVGMSVQHAKEKILQNLIAKSRCDSLHEPTRKAFTRAGNPVVVAVMDDQWFLDYSSKEWKQKTHSLVEKMPIYPEYFKKSIHEAIDWLEKRPCIRKRGLGTKFPLVESDEWMIEPLSDSTIYMVFYIAVTHIRNASLSVEQLDEAFYDAALLGKKLPTNDTRAAIANKIFEEVNYWYPNDLRHTAPAHISNHISFFLFTHTLLFPEKFWPRGLTFNEMLVRNGVKMSKSKGNVIPLQHAFRDYSADLTRLFIVSSASFERVADWKDNQVPQVKSKLNDVERTLTRAIESTENKLTPAHEWLVENLRARLSEAYDAYDKFEYMYAAQKAFFETLNEVKRFRKVFGADESPAVKQVLKEWILLLSPITPFLAEELGERAKLGKLVSQMTVAKPQSKPNKAIEEQVVFIEGVLQDLEHVRKLVRGKQPKLGFIYSKDSRETAWLRDAQQALSKHTQFEIRVNDAHDPLGKMAKSVKGRPAIYLE
ncbi:MAG: leucine--tRNA ligase [Candidatus Diapherotrites archaeon]|uniref:Leucine--tRNA ligase n=1 Tax=Candidatus Iainarchaeum sp. TaxID=3101447 RepID=A0A8T4C6M2_9ARCH|nr:leucine--tRNA ligase [Candidatus Diapherotrites archaeon]